MSSSSGKVFAGFVIGAALGVAAGLLFAPSSGVETRKKLKKRSEELTDDLAVNLEKKLDDVKKYMVDLTDDTRARLKKKPKAANEA